MLGDCHLCDSPGSFFAAPAFVPPVSQSPPSTRWGTRCDDGWTKSSRTLIYAATKRRHGDARELDCVDLSPRGETTSAGVVAIAKHGCLCSSSSLRCRRRQSNVMALGDDGRKPLARQFIFSYRSSARARTKSTGCFVCHTQQQLWFVGSQSLSIVRRVGMILSFKRIPLRPLQRKAQLSCIPNSPPPTPCCTHNTLF